MTMPASPVDAQNAALDAYNIAVNSLNDAQSKLDGMDQRPPDTEQGHDAGGKEWDRDHAALVQKIEAARAQAAQASKQYADMLEQQSKQQAADTSPGAKARADRAQAQADYYRARADGYAAKDAASQQAAQTRADTALQRSNTAADRVAAQNDKDTSAADLNRAQADNTRATTEHTQAETANMESPADKHAAERQQIYDRAQAEADAYRTKLQADIDSGAKLPEAAAKDLDEFYKEQYTRLQSSLSQTDKQFEYDLAQPNKDRELGVSEQNANTNAAQVENNRVYQQNQTALDQAKGQADVLTKQAAAGQSALEYGTKLGVAPPMALIQMAYGPLYAAQNLIANAVKNGQASPSWTPTLQAPRPPQPAAAAPTSAPTPAPNVAAPTPAPDPFAQSDLPEGRAA